MNFQGHSLSIHIDGLDKLVESFSDKKIMKALLPEFGSAVQKFHATLEEEVSLRYNTRKKLSSALRGGQSLRTSTSIGKKVLEFGIEYESSQLPLRDFITSITASGNTGRFRTPQPGVGITKKGLVKRKKPNPVYHVTVVRGQQKQVHGYKGHGTFMLENSPKQLATRMTAATWKVEPEERESYWQLSTLSLSQMAENLYNKSPRIDAAIGRLQERVATVVTKAME